MIFRAIITGFLFVCLLVTTASSFPSEQEKYKGNTFLKISPKEFFITEGVFITFSALASNRPKDYGVVLALSVPLMMAGGKPGDDSSTNASIVFFAGIETLAFYNMWVLDKNNDMPEENFRQNLIGWHVIYAAAAATEYFSRRMSRSKYSYFVAPMDGGSFAQVSYKF